MAKKSKPKKIDVRDEPGADERFEEIVKRALSTSPKRAKGAIKADKSSK